MSFSRIPEEVLGLIFSYALPKMTVFCRVCKKWNETASSNVFWEAIALQALESDHPTHKEMGKIILLKRDPPLENIKQYMGQLYGQFLQSNDAIANCFLRFIQKITENHRARFTCILGTGSRYQTISVFFQDKRNGSSHLNLQEDYFAPQGILNNGELKTKTIDHLKKKDGSPLYASCFSAISDHHIDDLTQMCYWQHLYISDRSPFSMAIIYPATERSEVFQKLEVYIAWVARDKLNLLTREYLAQEHVKSRKIKHL